MQAVFKLALAAATAACVAGAAAAQNIVLRSSDTHPDGYPTVEAVKYMGQLLEERSNGRIKIEVYHSSQLGEERDALEQTRFGVIDMIRTSLGPISTMVPEATVFSMPYIFRSVDHMHTVIDGAIGAEFLAAFEPYGLIGLAFYDAGARSFYTRTRAVKSIDDLKGLKYRVQQSDIFVDMMNALGADAVPMNYGEVYSAIQTGVIDGAENNFPSYVSSGHYDVAQNFTLDEHLIMPEIVAVSAHTWARLSPADQQLVRQAARDSVTHQRALWQAAEDKSRQAVLDGGGQIFAVEKQPFIDAMQEVHARHLTSAAQRDLAARIRAVR